MSKKTKPIIWLLFIVYVLFMIKMILFKMPFNQMGSAVRAISIGKLADNLKLANFMPFSQIVVYMDAHFKVAMKSLGTGIVLFVPLGYFIPTLSKHRQFKNVLIVGLLTSITFETLQLFLSLGRFDVDDIILNGLGIIFGFMIYKSIR